MKNIIHTFLKIVHLSTVVANSLPNQNPKDSKKSNLSGLIIWGTIILLACIVMSHFTGWIKISASNWAWIIGGAMIIMVIAIVDNQEKRTLLVSLPLTTTTEIK